jgi:small subunit ribosomal protein S20
LANIKSAIKRNRQNIKRRLRNRQYRGAARSYIKRARIAMEEGELEIARTETLSAVRALDKAVAKGVIHKNNAARRKGRLMKSLAALESEA